MRSAIKICAILLCFLFFTTIVWGMKYYEPHPIKENVSNTDITEPDIHIKTEYNEHKEPEGTVQVIEVTDIPEIEDENCVSVFDVKNITSTKGNTLEVFGDFKDKETDIQNLENILRSFNGQISLVASSVDGRSALCYNSDMTYESQCTIKAAYLYSICKYMDENNTDENIIITYQPHHFIEGSGTVKKSAFGTAYTLKQLIKLSLSISDNTAYKMLYDYFGNGIKNQLMTEIGCDSLVTHNMWGWAVKPKDYVVLWKEIYYYFETETKYAKIMKEACTNTLYAYNCTNVDADYSHKSGDSFDWLDCHDVCLIWKEEPYILAIFTHANIPDTSEATMISASDIIHNRLYQ